jgi:hypothetical protein
MLSRTESADLGGVFVKILEEFRHRYVLTYTPRGVAIPLASFASARQAWKCDGESPSGLSRRARWLDADPFHDAWSQHRCEAAKYEL